MKRIYVHVAACTEQGEIKLHRFKTGAEAKKFCDDFVAKGGRILVGWGEA